MVSNLLMGVISGLSYATSNVGENLNEMKIDYGEQSYSWGNSQFSAQYFSNVKVLSQFGSTGPFNSLDGYVMADHNTKQVYVVFPETQEPLDWAENATLASKRVFRKFMGKHKSNDDRLVFSRKPI